MIVTQERLPPTPAEKLDRLIERGLAPNLPLQEIGFQKAMISIIEQWDNVLRNDSFAPRSSGASLGQLSVLRNVSHLVRQPSDLLEIGNYLLKKFQEVYGRGSDQFLHDLVPSICESGYAQTFASLKEWLDTAVAKVSAMGCGERVYPAIANKIQSGEISSPQTLSTYPYEQLPFEQQFAPRTPLESERLAINNDYWSSGLHHLPFREALRVANRYRILLHELDNKSKS